MGDIGLSSIYGNWDMSGNKSICFKKANVEPPDSIEPSKVYTGFDFADNWNKTEVNSPDSDILGVVPILVCMKQPVPIFY